MNAPLQRFVPIACLVLSALCGHSQKQLGQWVTNYDRSALFQKQDQLLSFSATSPEGPTILVNPAKSYQSIDGFGFALTGGSAQAILQMSPKSRDSLLQELFGTKGNAIGISYIRLSIGASDLNDRVFSYDDLPEGETDVKMQKFDLGQDKKDVIPVMKQILKINPAIKILGSPWSPPAWMKNFYDTRGGRIKPEYYAAYALYFVKYIQQMKAQGIIIDAVTVQNEPLHPGNNPSVLMPAPDQAEFVRDHLGPAFAKSSIKTKIIIYDHNADRPDYPILILNDKKARKYIDGSGFHLYGGTIDALTDVHDAHPDKNIYFTEQMVVDFGRGGTLNNSRMNVAQPVSRLIVGATRNWSRNVIEWNLAADPQFKPFTDRGGCNMCQGAVTIGGDTVSRNLAYYSLAHASKFVRPGSVRIESNELDGLSNVAFRTPTGGFVLIVANTTKENKTFNIRFRNQSTTSTIQAGSAATYTWN